MKGKIGLFDSGLGGLSILKELIKVLPNEDYLFYEDSINNPYGNKTEEELFKINCDIVDYLLAHDCKIIVIACNTATTMCIASLREKYKDVIFVGTEPAIKVAYDHGYKNTIILSTPNTKNSKKVYDLTREYKNIDQNIYNVSGENLANLIELDQKEDIMHLLKRVLNEYKGIADSIVLGCTHYSLIKDEIQSVLPNVVLLDGTVGIAREVKRQLELHDLLSKSNEQGIIEIVNTKDQALINRSLEILKEEQ